MDSTFPPKDRGAGILMHVTSLHSNFGIGDFGPEAKKFVSFLHEAGQKYWQILPLSPVQAADGFSPYSTISSMAGNDLLISPELLLEDGLISLSDLNRCRLRNKGKSEYQKAKGSKESLFDVAYKTFGSRSQSEFEQFIHREAYWLDDYVMYQYLKEKYDQAPWYEWPEDFKLRDTVKLQQLWSASEVELKKLKWRQFVFVSQWSQLKKFANSKNVKIIGDVPFYMNYDSVDVWTHGHLFKLDAYGQPEAIAGVPPDYFNADGQLWGMPVYNWEAMKQDRYNWWVTRIRKNVELYDIIRLDHFRAFADYWEVPGGEKTAKHGTWKRGPGESLFLELRKELGEMPFIAEDLGDINAGVLRLRDHFEFPGMKVLQFAFGENMPSSEHIPHNYSENFVAYTGTHDNNTTRGWYLTETDKPRRKQIDQYCGCSVGPKNIHLAFIRLAYASVAKTVIVPLQDVLALGPDARMNTPASTHSNWLWRIQPHQPKTEHRVVLNEFSIFYGRN